MVAINLPFEYPSFRVVEVALLDESVTLHHDELFELGIVPVLPFGNARPGNVDADLTSVVGVDQFCERTAVINVHLQRECHFIFWEIAEIGAV